MYKIVNLRGASGSGKSFALRRIRDAYSDDWTAHRIEKRKQPLYYTAEGPARSGGRKLAILGHYETACGGCDTITKPDFLFETIQMLLDQGYDIIWEWLLMSMDFKRTEPMSHNYKTLVLGLDTTLEKCLSSINERRHARNPDLPPVNPKNTTNKHRGVKQTVARLQAAGLDCEWHDRETIVTRALEALTCPR